MSEQTDTTVSAHDALAEVWEARHDWWETWIWRGIVGIVFAGSMVVLLLFVLAPEARSAYPVMVGIAVLGSLWAVISVERSQYAIKQAAVFRAGITVPTGSIR